MPRCITRKKGRVVDVVTQVIFGTPPRWRGVGQIGGEPQDHTAFGSANGTDRNRKRKVRKTYCFSKDWWVHRGHVLHDVQLQLLLAGEDAEDGIW